MQSSNTLKTESISLPVLPTLPMKLGTVEYRFVLSSEGAPFLSYKKSLSKKSKSIMEEADYEESERERERAREDIERMGADVAYAFFDRTGKLSRLSIYFEELNGVSCVHIEGKGKEDSSEITLPVYTEKSLRSFTNKVERVANWAVLVSCNARIEKGTRSLKSLEAISERLRGIEERFTKDVVDKVGAVKAMVKDPNKETRTRGYIEGSVMAERIASVEIIEMKMKKYLLELEQLQKDILA